MAMRFTLEVKYRILHILIVDHPERVGVPLGLQRDLDWGWMFLSFAIIATHPAIDAIAGGTKRGRVTVSQGCNNIVVSPKCQAKLLASPPSRAMNQRHIYSSVKFQRYYQPNTACHHREELTHVRQIAGHVASTPFKVVQKYVKEVDEFLNRPKIPGLLV